MDWVHDIQQNKPSPIYLFYGAEGFLIEQSIKWMQKKLAPSDPDPSWTTSIDLSQTSVTSLLEEASMPSLLGNRRLILGTNAFFFSANTDKNAPDHNIEKLIKYIKSPIIHNVLVFTLNEAKLDKRTRLVKEMNNYICQVEFKPFSDQRLREWIIKQFDSQGCTINSDAVEEMISRVGNNLYRLKQEAFKLCTFIGEPSIISKDVILKLVTKTPESDIFKFIDLVAKKQLGEALKTWYDLTKSGTDPISGLALLIRQFRLILMCKLLAEQGNQVDYIAKELKVHIYPAKLAVNISKSFSAASLKSILKNILDIDFKVKSGMLDKRIAIEKSLFNWCLDG